MNVRELVHGQLIHCPTLKDAMELLTMMDEAGFLWRDGAALSGRLGKKFVEWEYLNNSNGLCFEIIEPYRGGKRVVMVELYGECKGVIEFTELKGEESV